MFGWRISLRMWISLATLSTSETSVMRSFSRILMATFSPVKSCVPNFTFPKVPSPIDFSEITSRNDNLTYWVMPNVFSSFRLIGLCMRDRCWSRGIFWPLRGAILVQDKALTQQGSCIILTLIISKHCLLQSFDLLITPLRRYCGASFDHRWLVIVLHDCGRVECLIDVCLIHHFPLVYIGPLMHWRTTAAAPFFLIIFVRIFILVIYAIACVIILRTTYLWSLNC